MDKVSAGGPPPSVPSRRCCRVVERMTWKELDADTSDNRNSWRGTPSPSAHWNPFPHPYKAGTILILQIPRLNHRPEFLGLLCSRTRVQLCLCESMATPPAAPPHRVRASERCPVHCTTLGSAVSHRSRASRGWLGCSFCSTTEPYNTMITFPPGVPFAHLIPEESVGSVSLVLRKAHPQVWYVY